MNPGLGGDQDRMKFIMCIQGDSGVMDMNVEDGFPGLCEQKVRCLYCLHIQLFALIYEILLMWFVPTIALLRSISLQRRVI